MSLLDEQQPNTKDKATEQRSLTVHQSDEDDGKAPSASSKPSAKHIRGMTRQDISAVSRIFVKAFRHKDAIPSPGLERYFEELFFECPFYDESYGTIVHEDYAGQIDSAIAVVPMRMMACNRILVGRLMCAYMADPENRSGGAARLTLTLRPRQQDFCFSDTASQVSAAHIQAIGGMVLPIESLEWRRIFRPMAHLAQAAERRWPLLRWLKPALLAAPLDASARLFGSHFRAPIDLALHDTPMSDDAFIDAAPRLIAHFAIRPVWSRPELEWLLRMARQNTAWGPLTLRAVRNASGELIGCFVYYGAKGRPANVLNILSAPGHESDVVTAMLAHFDLMKCPSASGMGQPFLIDAFKECSGVDYRHRSYFWVTTRHADVRDAIHAGNIFSGGLASEAWSRLLTDFK